MLCHQAMQLCGGAEPLAQDGAETAAVEPTADLDDADTPDKPERADKSKDTSAKKRAAVRRMKKQLREEYFNPGKTKKGAKDKKEMPWAQAAPPPGAKTLDPRGDPLECQGCNMLFATRNQLFTHLKKTGHAAFK